MYRIHGELDPPPRYAWTDAKAINPPVTAKRAPPHAIPVDRAILQPNHGERYHCVVRYLPITPTGAVVRSVTLRARSPEQEIQPRMGEAGATVTPHRSSRRLTHAGRGADRIPGRERGRGGDCSPDANLLTTGDHQRPSRRFSGGGRANRRTRPSRPPGSSEAGPRDCRDHAGTLRDSAGRLAKGRTNLRSVRDLRIHVPIRSSVHPAG